MSGESKSSFLKVIMTCEESSIFAISTGLGKKLVSTAAASKPKEAARIQLKQH
jgi:hypothetical protein